MNNKEIKFSNIKIKIIPVIFLLIITVFITLYGSKKSYLDFKDRNEKAFYLMDKISDILDKDFLDTREDKTEKIGIQDKIYGAVSGFVQSYQDPYTVFLPPEDKKDLEESVSGEFVGIGVEFEILNGVLTVVSPLPDTPAFKAGLKPKDIILEVDSESTINRTSAWAVSKIRGEKNTEVKLKIVRVGKSEPFEIKIKRAKIDIPVIKTYNQQGVFIIKLYSFTEKSPELFFDAIKEFRKTKNKNLIIDLRGNPGGHLFAAVYIAGIFLEKDKIIITEEHKEGKISTLKSGKYHTSNKTIDIINDDIKIAVLVNEGSASAAEILAGALNQHNKAILLGQNTFGKGTVQTVKQLDDNTSLKYTIAKWILPNGKWLSHKGLPVDIKIDITEKEAEQWSKISTLSKKIDPQLEKAIVEIKKINNKKELISQILKSRKEREEKKDKNREEKIKNILNQN